MRAGAAAICFMVATTAHAAPPQLRVTLKDAPQVMLRPGDGCDGHDVPDLAVRAFRTASGQIAMFALHYINGPCAAPRSIR